MAREYFCAYHDYLERMQKLSDAECGRLFRALLQYSAARAHDTNGEVDTLINLQGREEVAFDFMKVQIDRDIEAYEKKCTQLAANASKRWMAENASTNGCKSIQKDARQCKRMQEKEKEKEEEEEKEEKSIPPKPPKGGDAHSQQQKQKAKKRNSSVVEKKAYGSFGNVMLSDEEYAKLTAAEVGLIEELSGYIASSGKKYASHYATLINWQRRRNDETSRSEKKGRMYLSNNDSFSVEDLESIVEVL